MEIPLIVHSKQYSEETVLAWQTVWKTICDMSYHNTNIQEKIVTTPGYFQMDDKVMLNKDEQAQTYFYSQRYPNNDEQLTLDYIWKKYSSAKPHVVREFRYLHVPYSLYYVIGVNSWFRECFPNCKVTFWEQ
jgi:hypothetical protein